MGFDSGPELTLERHIIHVRIKQMNFHLGCERVSNIVESTFKFGCSFVDNQRKIPNIDKDLFRL